ncbi:hypothetical protein [Clostridium sp. MF28]
MFSYYNAPFFVIAFINSIKNILYISSNKMFQNSYSSCQCFYKE